MVGVGAPAPCDILTQRRPLNITVPCVRPQSNYVALPIELRCPTMGAPLFYHRGRPLWHQRHVSGAAIPLGRYGFAAVARQPAQAAVTDL